MGFDFRSTGAPANLAAISAYLIVFLVHLTGQIFASHSVVTQVSQVLLMPTLAGILFSATITPRSKLVKLAFVALFFSWLGDTLPRFLSGDAAFLAMVGGFLVAQVIYIVAFFPYRRRSIMNKPLLVAPYLAAAVVLVAVCFKGAGSLFIPIAVYAAVIVGMAVFATGLSVTGAIGGIVFMVSDALIALGAFSSFSLPGQGFWVMLTYVLGQTLLIQAVIGQEERNRPSVPPPVRQMPPVSTHQAPPVGKGPMVRGQATT